MKKLFSQLLQIKYTEYVDCVNFKVIQPPYTPYYMEGSKGQPNYIRTMENVGDLFKQKLIKKWENDKIKTKLIIFFIYCSNNFL